MCFSILGGVSSEEIPEVITRSKGKLRIALSDIAKFPCTRVMPVCISTSNALKCLFPTALSRVCCHVLPTDR